MSEIRKIITESIERLLADQVTHELLLAAEDGKYPDALWRMIEESGFTRVLVPESMGGSGGGWPDAYPVLRAVGYYRVPAPLAETVVGNDLLARAGMPITDGPLCLIEQEADLRIERRDHRILVTGRVHAAPWARASRWLVIAGKIEAHDVLLRVSSTADGMTILPGANLAKEHRDDVVLSDVLAEDCAFVDARLMSNPVRSHGALTRAIGIVGALESILAQSVEYAKERVQFGRPIAKFQAIQHMLALLACEVTAASTAAQAACNAMAKPDPGFEIAVAKVRAGRAAGVGALIAHQIHGAMGLTYEHTLHFGTRRLWSWRSEFGNESTWAIALGAQAIRRGGGQFWSDLTARTAVGPLS